MARFFVLASYDKKLGAVTYPFSDHIDLMERPVSATLGFRQVMRKCISAAFFDSNCGIEVTWLKRTILIRDIFYFESEDTALSETEGGIFIGLLDVSSGFDEFGKWCCDQVNDSDECRGFSIASGSCAGGFEDAVQAFETSVGVGRSPALKIAFGM